MEGLLFLWMFPKSKKIKLSEVIIMKFKYCRLAGAVFAISLCGGVEASSELENVSLEGLLSLDITVASNVISDARKQPVSVTAITQDQIRLSGARTLSELLTIYVPGYFLVEDQDDTIAGFRGLVPDNNSKVMLLINGQNINTEWFWGPSDAILNGMDMKYIDRIEVIRGPGSVTQGSGALLGVVNIVTKKGRGEENPLNVSYGVGKHGLSTTTIDSFFSNEDTQGYFYYSEGGYDGQTLRNKGFSLRTDQGLSVYERRHRLKRNEYENVLANVKHGNLEFNIFSFQHARDLYSFFRDREVVTQKLEGVNANYTYQINDNASAKLSAHYEKDDYGLRSHGGNIQTQGRLDFESSGSSFSSIINGVSGLADSKVESGLTMGGTREIRRGAKLLVNIDEAGSENNKLAVGMEVNQFLSGLPDDAGNNFIINEEIQRIGISPDNSANPTGAGSVNELNQWVKKDSVVVRSFFMEDFLSINDQLDVFAAFRYDNHADWGSQVSPRVGALFDIDNTHLFRLSYQTGFRGAVGVQFAGGFVQDGFLSEGNFDTVNGLDQDLVDTDFSGDGTDDGAINLKAVDPETIKNFELAYTFTHDNTRINAIAFYNIVEDILTAAAHSYDGLGWGDKVGSDDIGTWNGHWYYQNQDGKLKQIGLELEAEHEFDWGKIAFSHSHVEVQSADPGTIGIYVLPGEKNAAFPEDVTRLQWSVPFSTEFADITVSMNHTYYWDFDSPTGTNVDGAHLANFGLSVVPSMFDDRLTLSWMVKNVFDEDGLYPINATGNVSGTDGAAAIEEKTFWLDVAYRF